MIFFIARSKPPADLNVDVMNVLEVKASGGAGVVERDWEDLENWISSILNK